MQSKGSSGESRGSFLCRRGAFARPSLARSVAVAFFPARLVFSTLKLGLFHDSESAPFAGVGRALGRALAKMHNASIIHGDLTSSNVMLRRCSATALADEASAHPSAASAVWALGEGLSSELSAEAGEAAQKESLGFRLGEGVEAANKAGAQAVLNELREQKQASPSICLIDFGLSSTSSLAEVRERPLLRNGLRGQEFRCRKSQAHAAGCLCFCVLSGEGGGFVCL